MARPLTVASLCAGIGGFDLGLERAGIAPVLQCEIDPGARSVLERHWPDVARHDDLTTLEREHLRGASVDVVCGGTPCQDLSVAGRRAGLSGEQSRLFYDFVRFADAVAPRWVLWENVPGVLSTNDGADFAIVLRELTGFWPEPPEDGWRNTGVCVGPKRAVVWRVLDAQFFGVAQRRRRVFIVGRVGDAAGAAAVLLEPESCDGNPPPSREAGEGVAGTLGGGAAGRGWSDDTDRAGAFVPELARCLLSSNERGDGESETFLPTAFMWQAAGNNSASGAMERDMTPTLPRHQTIAVAYLVAMRGRGAEMGEPDLANALRDGGGVSSRGNYVAFSENQRGEVLETDYARQITAGGGKPGQGYPAVRMGMAVRRLTPRECERLQGFPDDWTEGLSDSARYQTLGNAVCVPVAEWIGRRIVTQEGTT